MSLSFTTPSILASAGQQISLGSLIAVTGSDNPTYLVVSGLDRSEYVASSNGNRGKLVGNGHTAGFNGAGGDANSAGIMFTWDPVTRQYVNSHYGALNSIVMTASTDTNRVEALSLFASNDSTTLSQYLLDPLGLMSNAASSYMGTVTVSTQPALAGQVPSQATPQSIAAVAQTFIGQTWNVNGCWILASSIAAEAGASLPLTTTMVNTPGQANGEWMVAYNGPTGATGDWQSMLTTGDVVVFQTTSGIGHVMTITGGSGNSALTIDNTKILNANGTAYNSARDGSANDITIPMAHYARYDLAGVAASSVVIYRLDTPVITAATNLYMATGQDRGLNAIFSAADPAGKAVTSYQVYDTTAGDSFSVGGVSATAATAATALTVSGASLSSVSLHSSGGVPVAATGTLMVRASNGTYWGDWTTVNVTVTPTVISTTAANVASGIATLSAAAQAGTLTAIRLTDGGTPTLTLGADVLALNRAAVDDVAGNYILSVAGDNQTLTIAGSNGTNRLSAGLSGGNHTLYAGAGLSGADTLTGGFGADVLYGSTNAAGAALLISGAGRNILNGGLGGDRLIGGGTSVLNAGAAYQVLLGGYSSGASDTLNAAAAGHDFLAVAMGSNVLNAGSGVGSVLEGGTGTDQLNGSTAASGATILIAGSGANVLNGGLGADTLVGGGASLLNAGSGAGQLLLGGYTAAAHDTLNAGSSDAVLAVATGNNSLNAGTGQATLLGGMGNDTLTGGGGAGVLVGGTGRSLLQGGAGADTLVGTGHTRLVGGSGASGRTLLLGGFSTTANDTLVGGTGSNETLAVARGNNELHADPTGVGGNDTLIAGAGNDTLYGAGYGSGLASAGATSYTVNGGNTVVLGGVGDDMVAVNGPGSLTFDGGAGGNNVVTFAGHAAADATFTTNAAGTTVVSFSNSSQTATLTHVSSVVFGLGGAVHALAA